MRSAGRQRYVAVPTTTVGASPSRHPARPGAGCPTGQVGLAPSPQEVADADAATEAELVLASSGALSSSSSSLTGPRIEHYRQLAIAIRQRIETRLAGRVRELVVRIHGNTIVLEGRCATYYTKQLAQHAALGVLDGEPFQNAIVVTM